MMPFLRSFPTPVSKRSTPGFTLAELLIALAILGVIATFTIPKILVAQSGAQSNAKAKEMVGAVSAAYNNYKQTVGGAIPSTTTLDVIKPYLNYIKQDSTALLQDYPGASDVIWDCSNSNLTCLKMANGGTLFWMNDQSFNGTSNINGLTVYFDPDGANVGSIIASNPSVSVCFILYYNGKIVDRNNSLPGTTNSYPWSLEPGTTYNPNWFSW